ncbi:hypothetical protein Sdia_19940 [Streptomyces diastaticus subsp. diastaticus]|uniref:PA14 domain-containing protein n=1 Tax=Streptomyces diastaticus subsp. diastaticus TaxID=68040 RepID=A0ABQ1CLD3_STRDI|nr:hypothetical protein Sdia_19940 [Streptomyces diastaticus subsp. diastaticus]GGU32540.1 hypothetical protein GCM10015534_39130 [Streptomyces diastaticus subsp. diastaticus]
MPLSGEQAVRRRPAARDRPGHPGLRPDSRLPRRPGHRPRHRARPRRSADQWVGSDLPEGVTHDTLHSIEITGSYTPPESGRHTFGTRGLGAFRLTVGGRELWSGTQGLGEGRDPFEAFFGAPTERATAELTAGTPVDISLEYVRTRLPDAPLEGVSVSLVHLLPQRDPDELIAEAARQTETAVVVVATTEAGEPERPAQRLAGFALAEASPGEATEVTVDLPDRAFETWDESTGGWVRRPGHYELRAARSAADPRLALPLRED